MLLLLVAACSGSGPSHPSATLVVSASALGAEGEILALQARRFEQFHPGIRVQIQPAPDAADQRHQLYVQWLNARTPTPDVLQLDVVWTAEFAAAGWLAPLGVPKRDTEDFFPATLVSNTFEQTLYALPWFVDVGMLYWRTDRMAEPPPTWEVLVRDAQRLGGFVWQGARYEGLVTVFVEVLGAHGGRLLGEDGEVLVDSAESHASLAALRRCVEDARVSSSRVLTFQEEQARFDFQNGGPAFMRNWPYAWPLMQQASSSVAGKFAVAPMPAARGGAPTAALGGAQLAVNAASTQQALAVEFILFLTSSEQLLEKARVAGHYPPRMHLYDRGLLDGVLPIPPSQARAVIERAVPRPVTPLYTELSNELQIALHAALSGQLSDAEALTQAAARMRAIKQRASQPASTAPLWPWLGALLAALSAVVIRAVRAALALDVAARREAKAAMAFLAPTLCVITLVTVFPLLATAWESLHQHDLRTPWLGMPWAGLANFAELWTDTRFLESLGHSAAFALVSVTAELLLGTALALALNEAFRGRAALRALVLLPWAVPTVVAALVWRFMFDASVGAELFTRPLAAWIPVVIGDVWKTVPFVALLLLASLQGLDASLYEAARIDGADVWHRFTRITLPMLRPTMVVLVLFRSLDALRVFDLIYVMTGGGPGTATEPLALFAFNTLLQNLRFGYGSAVSITIFLLTAAVATVFVRVLGADVSGRRA